MTRWAFLALAILASKPTLANRDIEWRKIALGVEYAAVALAPKPAIGDGVLHVVRSDPSRARLRALATSQVGGEIRTARAWRDGFKLVAVINAGMYEGDFSTHTGFFRIKDHVNSARWVKSYQSSLVVGPRAVGLPAADVRDAQAFASSSAHNDYDIVIQNLRLIRGSATNVWRENGRRWSEAAVAIDRGGKILFLFCRSPFSMHDFNEMLIALPLGIVRAMHVEGGPEASLSVQGEGIDLNLSGSYETGFNENDENQKQWPLPNVLGIEAEPWPQRLAPTSGQAPSTEGTP